MYNMVYNPQTTSRYRLRLYLFFRQQAYCQAGRLYLYPVLTTSSIALVRRKAVLSLITERSAACILDQDVSVVIQDFCIINWFDVISAVCNGCIGCTQFNICDTAGDTAKCSGEVCIAPYITIGIFVSLCSMSKGCKTESCPDISIQVQELLFPDT